MSKFDPIIVKFGYDSIIGFPILDKDNNMSAIESAHRLSKDTRNQVSFNRLDYIDADATIVPMMGGFYFYQASKDVADKFKEFLEGAKRLREKLEKSSNTVEADIKVLRDMSV